jgi:SulP family sulfate permease
VDTVLQAVLDRANTAKPSDVKLVVCILSASPFMDLAGSTMLHKRHAELAARKISLRVVGAHARVRELLCGDEFAEKVGGIERSLSLDDMLKSRNESIWRNVPGRRERAQDSRRSGH